MSRGQRISAGTLAYPLTSSHSSESFRSAPTTLSDVELEHAVARLDEDYVEPLPGGAACTCCGSTDIDPSEGRIASYWFQCSECKISVRYVDLVADGERVGYRETICQRHGPVAED